MIVSKLHCTVHKTFFDLCEWFDFFRTFTKSARIHRLDRQIVRTQLDIMPKYHYVQNEGKLMMLSGENGQKPQFGQFFFDDFEVKYLQIANFTEK